MSITPIITFKAGKCDLDNSSKPYKVKPETQPGYVYLYSEDDLVHFCWRERNAPIDQAELDLVMVPADAHFLPYDAKNQPQTSARTNGRIFVLKFSSSSQRYFFWLQSKPQGRSGDPTWFSPRDRKIGEIVDTLLQGEEVNVARELASISNNNDDSGGGGRRRDDDDDETMEDVEGHGDPNRPHGGSGGAGPGATGGDVREEGEEAREGGADGARAAASGNVDNNDAAAAVRNFLNSLNQGGGGGGGGGSGGAEGKFYPMLSDLLPPPVTVPVIRTAEAAQVDELLSFLPPSVLVLAQQGEGAPAPTEGEPNAGGDDNEPTPAAAEAARQAMSLGQKKALLEKVLRSPQFAQSLASLTMAIRDGGLPSIADALAVDVPNGGYVRGGRQVSLGGGDAVEAFVEGVKATVQQQQRKQ